MAAALIFELSKVERPEIRERLVGHLCHIDDTLADKVAEGLGMALPTPPTPAREPIADLPPSPALSILENGPASFAGRKLGIQLTDGVDSGEVQELLEATVAAKATPVIVAPRIGGVMTSDGTHIGAAECIDGGPSVLFDAVAVLLSPQWARPLAGMHVARVWLADAYAHKKLILCNEAAAPLLDAAGLPSELDAGMLRMGAGMPGHLLERCAALRFWERVA